jgi:homoserine O-acetyltransferase
MKKHLHSDNGTFLLESGETLTNIKLQYRTYGTLSSEKDNVVWVFHPLSMNTDIHKWWSGIFGREKILDPNKFFIICVNNLGSCYGSTGPGEINPNTNRPYFHTFPLITIRDIVKSLKIVRHKLGIKRIELAIGGSMGGALAIQWASEEPALFERLILLACSSKESAWAKALHTSQKMAIEADHTWGQPDIQAGQKGLMAARAMGCISYKSREYYSQMQGVNSPGASSYQRYQGEKIIRRFNAYSYYTLLDAMDSHDIAFGGKNQKSLLARIKAKCLLIAISNDGLVSERELKNISEMMAEAETVVINSIQGHDGFITETDEILRLYKLWHTKEIPVRVF